MKINAEGISRRLADRLSNAGEARHLEPTTVSRRVIEAIPKRHVTSSTVHADEHLARLHATVVARKGAARANR
jgi:hypothetical protein